MSNFVIAASVVAIGVSAASSATFGVLVVLAVVVALANALAYGYSVRSGQWARVHKHRADFILADNWSYFAEVQKFVYDEKRDDRPDTPVPHSHASWTRREVLQRLLHVLLIAGAVAVPVVAVAMPTAEVTTTRCACLSRSRPRVLAATTSALTSPLPDGRSQAQPVTRSSRPGQATSW